MRGIELPLREARRIAINTQLLGGVRPLSKGKVGVVETLESLGYVQIDTLNVIARSHHHTLWTRLGSYQPSMLYELQAVDRRVFEYWGHAMAYLPIADYRFYLPRMRSFEDKSTGWESDQVKAARKMLKPVLERITQEGPLSSKDFSGDAGKSGSWWDWKPAKLALEVLFWQGKLMVRKRENFQKVYDLTERVLPESVDRTYPSDRELGHFLIQRPLGALGIATEKEIARFSKSTIKNNRPWLRELIENGDVIEVQVKGGPKGQTYAPARLFAGDTPPTKVRYRVQFLSPFDNLVIQRERLKWLFDFEYVIETYTPRAKRKYGYFVLPILWRDRIVGRIDLKADRKTGVLIVHNLYFEPKFHPGGRFLAALSTRLKKTARFNQCASIELNGSKVEFPEILEALERLI